MPRLKPAEKGLCAAVLMLCIGCSSAPPYVGQGPHSQITRGQSIPPIDFIGNVLAVPLKIVLWNKNFSDHDISAQTEQQLVYFLDANSWPSFEDTVFRLNQYSPLADMKALIKNKHVGWPYRLILGFPTTLLYDVLLPGRVLPWGDYYNPFNNVAHLYSDDAAIALHEAGHALDAAQFRLKGLYATMRMVPFMDLYQEWRATDEAIDYLVDIEHRELEMHAYRTLWPAFGTYVGSYLPIPYVASVVGALGGHALGWSKYKTRVKYYERMDAAVHHPSLERLNEQPPLSNQ